MLPLAVAARAVVQVVRATRERQRHRMGSSPPSGPARLQDHDDRDSPHGEKPEHNSGHVTSDPVWIRIYWLTSFARIRGGCERAVTREVRVTPRPAPSGGAHGAGRR